jgi:hypothetical protein
MVISRSAPTCSPSAYGEMVDTPPDRLLARMYLALARGVVFLVALIVIWF